MFSSYKTYARGEADGTVRISKGNSDRNPLGGVVFRTHADVIRPIRNRECRCKEGIRQVEKGTRSDSARLGNNNNGYLRLRARKCSKIIKAPPEIVGIAWRQAFPTTNRAPLRLLCLGAHHTQSLYGCSNYHRPSGR